MSSRKTALANNPNGANSPLKAAATKQKRSFANIQREEAYGNPPPAKRLMTEVDRASQRTPPRVPGTTNAAEQRLFTKRSKPTAFTGKLTDARSTTKAPQQVLDLNDPKSLESVRNWQKHYRQEFPKFVFYFESVPEESRSKVRKQIQILNAREEKFFSNAVTHVITTRPIPTPDADAKKSNVRSGDVLYRAQALVMKIWSWEKMQRVMTSLFEVETGAQVPHNHNTRSNSTHGGLLSTQRNAFAKADLSKLLRNERMYGPSDRDQSVTTRELNLFKGPYIYIHDLDEKHRPIMVREYKKVTHKEDGDWPQFRSVANGKCPFVEEVDYSQRDEEKELLKQQRMQERENAAAAAPRTRATTAGETRIQAPKTALNKRPLLELTQGSSRRNASTATYEAKRTHNEMVTKPEEREASFRFSQNAFVSRAAPGRFFGGEPVASGVQPSNVTSAIRSQMVSSTAATPGAKAGTSKEVHGLQRKVLEKNTAPSVPHAPQPRLTTSHRMVNIAAAAAREESTARSAKLRAQEKLGVVPEEGHLCAEEEVPDADAAPRPQAFKKRKVERRDAKPGYCENCMEKFEDFDEHIQSRKHRRFAEKNDNWKELDALLTLLVRPRKYDDSDDE